MFKIIKNISSEVDIKETVDYVSEFSKNIAIQKGEGDLSNYLFQRLTYNQIMSSNSIRNLLFNDELLKKIMKSLKLSAKDVILMDNNCWHRGSFNKRISRYYSKKQGFVF
jgi:hypothetical protein